MDEVNGSDETGMGAEDAPFKTPLHAVIKFGGTEDLSFMIKKDGSDEYVQIAKAAAKKLQKNYDAFTKKKDKAEAAAASSVTVKEVVEENSIVEDQSLPKAEKIKIRQATEKRGVRVCVRGWVVTVRAQSCKLVFVDLRDGSDLYLQCVLAGPLTHTFEYLTTG